MKSVIAGQRTPWLYDENGYLNWDNIYNVEELMELDTPINFFFIVGARGTGKTYGALKWMLDNGRCFFYGRRTQNEAQVSLSDEMGEFSKISRDNPDNPDYLIRFQDIPKADGFKLMYHVGSDGENVGNRVGIGGPMMSMQKIRGYNCSDISDIFYDEFIPEKHVRRIRDEGDGIKNAYETINRNRELAGEPPVRLTLAANANTIDNDVLISWKLCNIVGRMQAEKREVYAIPERHIVIIQPFYSPIAEKKKETALYQACGEDSFSEMALGNKFADADMSFIHSRNLAEYKPLLSIGELNIYKHKSSNRYYATPHRSGNPPTYATTAVGIRSLQQRWLWLQSYYLDGLIDCETLASQMLFEKFFNIK